MIRIKNFLAVNKDYFGHGLKAIDLLILAQVEEFARNDCTCYMTDAQFMDITGAKNAALGAAFKRLEGKNIIVRDTKTTSGNGRANKRRTLYLTKNYRDAILKNNVCNVENQHIKNNSKDKENINLEEHSSSRVISNSTIRYY